MYRFLKQLYFVVILKKKTVVLKMLMFKIFRNMIDKYEFSESLKFSSLFFFFFLQITSIYEIFYALPFENV